MARGMALTALDNFDTEYRQERWAQRLVSLTADSSDPYGWREAMDDGYEDAEKELARLKTALALEAKRLHLNEHEQRLLGGAVAFLLNGRWSEFAADGLTYDQRGRPVSQYARALDEELSFAAMHSPDLPQRGGRHWTAFDVAKHAMIMLENERIEPFYNLWQDGDNTANFYAKFRPRQLGQLIRPAPKPPRRRPQHQRVAG